MQPHVHLEGALGGKVEAADVTDAAVGFVVRLDVRVQCRLDGEALGAVVALVRALSRVRADVPHQVARLAETLHAVLALVRVINARRLLDLVLQQTTVKLGLAILDMFPLRVVYSKTKSNF